MRLDRSLVYSLPTLLAAFALFELTDLDFWIPDRFFVAGEQRWVIGRDDALLRTIFYSDPRYCIALAAFVVLWRVWRLSGVCRQDALVALQSVTSVPGLVNLGKATTNTFLPRDVQRYGVMVPYIRTLERFPEESRPQGRGRGDLPGTQAAALPCCHFQALFESVGTRSKESVSGSASVGH